MVAVLIGFVLLRAFTGSGQMKGKSLDARSGLWVFPWLAGLTLISCLGDYPEPAAGNLNDLDFAVSTGLLLLLWVGVYVMAYTMRLRTPRPMPTLMRRCTRQPWRTRSSRPLPVGGGRGEVCEAGQTTRGRRLDARTRAR